MALYFVFALQIENSQLVIHHNFGAVRELASTTQAALIMAALSAFIIPIGTLVAGEGLATLVLECQSVTDFRELKWGEVEFTAIYRAVFTRYMQQGIADKETKQRAMTEVKGYLTSSGHPFAVRLLSAPNGQGERTAQKNGSGVKAHLIEHPEIAEMSVARDIESVREVGIQVERTTPNHSSTRSHLRSS